LDDSKYSSLNQPEYYNFNFKSANVIGSPYIKNGNSIYSLITPSDWQYSIELKGDDRPSDVRGTYAYVTQDIPTEIQNNNKLFPMAIHHNRSKYGMTQGSGYNNLGELNFSWLGNDKKVVHSFWYSPAENNGNLLPFTQMEVDLNLPNMDDVPIK
jgi:hypothetical protein